MLETIIVGAIVGVAAIYAFYRIFKKPSCGCGSSKCSSSTQTTSSVTTQEKKSSCGSSCQCGK